MTNSAFHRILFSSNLRLTAFLRISSLNDLIKFHQPGPASMTFLLLILLISTSALFFYLLHGWEGSRLVCLFTPLTSSTGYSIGRGIFVSCSHLFEFALTCMCCFRLILILTSDEQGETGVFGISRSTSSRKTTTSTSEASASSTRRDSGSDSASNPNPTVSAFRRF